MVRVKSSTTKQETTQQGGFLSGWFFVWFFVGGFASMASHRANAYRLGAERKYLLK